MNFFAHPITQGLVNQLVALHAILAGKRLADHHCFKVGTIADHGQMPGRQALGYAELNAFRSDQNESPYSLKIKIVACKSKLAPENKLPHDTKGNLSNLTGDGLLWAFSAPDRII